jgi:hypothetical protein
MICGHERIWAEEEDEEKEEETTSTTYQADQMAMISDCHKPELESP